MLTVVVMMMMLSKGYGVCSSGGVRNKKTETSLILRYTMSLALEYW